MIITQSIYDEFLDGQPDALYSEAWQSLMRYAARLLGPQYGLMAEDCVQESILSVYTRRETLRGPLHLKGTLLTAVHNRCISVMRRKINVEDYQQTINSEEPAFIASLIEQETIDMLISAINELPEQYRNVFHLSFEEGLKNTEAAKQLGISLSNYNKRKAKMMGQLRQTMKGYDIMSLLLNIVW